MRAACRLERIEIRWPSGIRQTLRLSYEEFMNQRSGETLSILQSVRTDTERFINAFINILFSSLVGVGFLTFYAVTKSWTLEWGSVSQLGQYSITRTTLKAGDKIIVTGQPARDAAAPRVLIETVKRPADGWEWKGRVQ